MKKILTLLIGLQLSCLLCFGQTQSKEELNLQIQAFREQAQKAFGTFLNSSNAVEIRNSAVASYPFIYDPEQIVAAKQIVLNTGEPVSVRATALSKIVNRVPEDEELGDAVIKWVEDARTPTDLRMEALRTVQTLSFSGFSMYSKRQQLMATLRTITKDPNIEFRRFAFNFLLAHGDTFAQSLLIDQLEKNKSDLLPTAETIRVLNLNPHGDYLPAVYRVFQQSTDPETRIEAIATLGNYPQAKGQIIAFLKDKKQRKEVRHMALGAINANYPADFTPIAQAIIEDPKESEDLKITAVNMETFRKKSNKEKKKKTKADDFDKSVRKLSRSEKSLNFRKALDNYLENVQPPIE